MKAKKEEDTILGDEDNVAEIVRYIDDKILASDSAKVDFDKIDEMDDDDFETFLSEISNSLYYKGASYESVVKEFLSDKPDIRKQFAKFCIEKMEELK